MLDSDLGEMVIENKTSVQLLRQAREVIPGGVNTSIRNISPELVFTEAKGAILVDADGAEYIDYHAAFGAIMLGHNFDGVNRAVAEQMEKIDLLGVGTTELEIRLAQRLCKHVPSAEKVLLCNSGSEATYCAIRLARAVTKRKKLIKFQGCYHGWHDSVAMNVISMPEKLGLQDPLSAGNMAEVTAQTLICTFNSLDEVEQAITTHKGDVAAIIVEPIPHNIGCVLPKPGFLEGLRELSTFHGVVLIFDEVITGFRHGLGGYQKVCGVTPDLTTLGKAMANGYPIAAICGKAELMDRFTTNPSGDVFFAGTYNGYSIGCAAALATIETLENPKVYEHIFRLGDKMRNGLKNIFKRLGVPHTIAGFGSVFLTYFLEGEVRSYNDLLRNDQQLFLEYRRNLLEHGVFKLPLNLKRNHISLEHTDEHIEKTLDACAEVMEALVGRTVVTT